MTTNSKPNPDDLDPLWLLLNGQADKNMVRIEKNKIKFAHYTSADVALQIIKHRTIWLRNATAMNDYTEVDHGIRLLQQALHVADGCLSESWGRIDKVASGLSDAIIKTLDSFEEAIRYHTYVFCLSEHQNSEDSIGRLSMWRAYARNPVGVAIVMNSQPFISEITSDGFGLFSTKIEYASDANFNAEIKGLVEDIELGAGLIKEVSLDEAARQIAFALCLRALSAKHPGFHEEQEWRIILNDGLFSKHVCHRCVESINGIPQVIYKLPIKDYGDFGVFGADPKSLIDRIIIGPSEQGYLIKEAFVDELQSLGFADAADRIIVSNIPLR